MSMISYPRRGTGRLDRCPAAELECRFFGTGDFDGVCGAFGIFETAVGDMRVGVTARTAVAWDDPAVLMEKSCGRALRISSPEAGQLGIWEGFAGFAGFAWTRRVSFSASSNVGDMVGVAYAYTQSRVLS
jgi:hypothetical protein